MGVFKNFIIGTLGLAIFGGAAALAIPQSRNFVLDKIAEQSEIYKTAMENNSKLEQDNKDLQETSSAQADAIAKLKTDLDTKSTALTKCQGDLETVTGKKTELETALASKEIEIQNLTQDKTELTTQLETANSEKTELQTTVTNLTSSVETLTAQKATIETQLATSESDKQALQTQLDSVNAQLTTTQSDLATAQSNLATKTSEIETLTSQLSTKQSELDQVNTEKANLQSQLDNANAQISTLQGQISTLETEKADLQKQVDNLTASVEVVMTMYEELDFSFPVRDSSLQTLQTAGTENYFDYESWNYFINNYNSDLMVEKYDVAKFSYQEVSAESRKYLCTCRPAYNFTSDYNFYFGSISEENKILDITSYFHNFGSYRDVSFFVENREVEIIDNDIARAKCDIVINTIGVNVSDANCFVNSERGYLYSSKTAGYLCYNSVKLDENGYTGFYPIYTVNNELVCNGSTVSISDDGRVVTYDGVDYILQEPDVTANNITAHIAGTVDGVQTTIHIGDGNNYIKFGDNAAISIEIMTIDELKTSGYMSIMRTDTSETIYLSNITLNYNASSGIYVISSATYNGVILAC